MLIVAGWTVVESLAWTALFFLHLYAYYAVFSIKKFGGSRGGQSNSIGLSI